MQKQRIFAADRTNLRAILRDISELKADKELWGDIFGIKVGLLTLMQNGLSAIKRIKRRAQIMMICDLKLAEIPYISARIARLVADAGADAIVLHGFVGEKVLDDVITAAPELKIFLVSEMTHNEGGFTGEHLESLALMAKSRGIYAIIGPGNRPERIRLLRKTAGGDVYIVAAGVSAQQDGNAKEALNAGADMVIEGRGLLQRLDESRRSGVTIPSIGVLFYLTIAFLLGMFLLRLSGSPWSQFPLASLLIATTFSIGGIIYQWWQK